MSEAEGTETWESPQYEASLPVTEKSNPLSRDLDRASANQIPRILHACDMQMIRGESRYQSLRSDAVLKTVMEVALRLEKILKDPGRGLVVLSGCGTSGRLAFLVATSFNKALKELNRQPIYTYTIAGGDKALFTSQEAPEDDATLGMRCLQEVSEGQEQVLFIGISCGLSAPFVAGQLDFCLRHLDVFTPVVMGFNPAHQARSEPITGCGFSFSDVMKRMQRAPHEAFVICPSVGPEAVSGSSRMKGGSATTILLQVTMQTAHDAAFAQIPVSLQSIRDHVDAFVRCVDQTYAKSEEMAAMITSAGDSLRRGRRVCYVGWGGVGVLGLIDASECVPTFGAGRNDVQGFIRGGYSALDNREGDLTALGPDFGISHEDFVQTVLPTLSDEDTVVLIYTRFENQSEVTEMAARVRDQNCKLHTIVHHEEDTHEKHWELSTKLMLNALSTGAHVLKGKIYQNYMIDLQVTNSKLYLRAARLLQTLSGLPLTRCEESLLKAIYEVDELSTVEREDVESHTERASTRSKVVPLALLCLLIGCTLKEAELKLENQPIVRDAVAACLAATPKREDSS